LLTISIAVPETRTSSVQASTILLHDDTCHCKVQSRNNINTQLSMHTKVNNGLIGYINIFKNISIIITVKLCIMQKLRKLDE